MCRDLKALREGGKIGDLRIRTGFLVYYIMCTILIIRNPKTILLIVSSYSIDRFYSGPWRPQLDINGAQARMKGGV